MLHVIFITTIVTSWENLRIANITCVFALLLPQTKLFPLYYLTIINLILFSLDHFGSLLQNYICINFHSCSHNSFLSKFTLTLTIQIQYLYLIAYWQLKLFWHEVLFKKITYRSLEDYFDVSKIVNCSWVKLTILNILGFSTVFTSN